MMAPDSGGADPLLKIADEERGHLVDPVALK